MESIKNGQSATKLLNSGKEQEERSTTIPCCEGVPFNINRVNWEMVDTTQNTCYIYALAHPETEEIRYIGLTINLNQRYRSHCSKNVNEKNNWKSNWVKKIKKKFYKTFAFYCWNHKKEEFSW